MPLSALEQAVQLSRQTSTSQTPAVPLTTAAAPFALSTPPDSPPAASSADHQIQLPQRRQQLCEHNRRKSRCRECGGSEICEHNRIRSQCRECGGRRYASIIGSGVRAGSVGDRRYASMIGSGVCAGSVGDGRCVCIIASRASANSAGRVPTADVATRGAVRGAASARTVSTAPPVRWVTPFWNPATQQVVCTISEEEELAEARAMGWDSEHLDKIEKAIFNHRGKSAALH